MAVHTVKDGTDVAMMGIWDVGLEPVTPRPSLAVLKEEVAAANVSIFSTGGDGSFDVVIAVGEELPSCHRAYLEPRGGPFLLHAATGRLCWASTEFYRTPKLGKILESQKLSVAPGDYAIRWFELVSLPRREFEEFLGAERYALWLRTERQGNTSCFILVAAIFAALATGLAGDWWLGLGVFATGATVLAALSWLRDRREPGRKELPELEYEFAQRTGLDGFSEVEEAFLSDKPDFGIELRRLEDGPSDLVGGWLSIHEE